MSDPEQAVPRAQGLWRHLRKDGSEFSVEITWARIRVGDRDVVIVVAVDVTERLRAEAERAELVAQLVTSRKRLAALPIVGRGRTCEGVRPARHSECACSDTPEIRGVNCAADARTLGNRRCPRATR